MYKVLAYSREDNLFYPVTSETFPSHKTARKCVEDERKGMREEINKLWEYYIVVDDPI